MYNSFYQTNTLHGRFFTSTREPDNYYSVKQVHGTDIVSLDSVKKSNSLINADGIFWKNSQLELGEKIVSYTADCLPILFEGTRYSALIHAGWRGVQKKIHLSPFIQKMDLKKVFIGPSIYVDSFQVGKEFLEYFPDSKNFVSRGENELYFDLQNEVKLNLQEIFKNIDITESYICTFENIQYNSFRRTGKADRNYNIFELKDD